MDDRDTPRGERSQDSQHDVASAESCLHETVTRLLHRWSAGEVAARDDLAVLVQREMRKLAQYQLSREQGHWALQATSLVNEAFLRLMRRNHVSFRNRGHFFGTVSQEMRRVLVDNFRRRSSQKREGVHISLDDALELSHERQVDLVKLDDALRDLETFNSAAARIVELRFFCGLTYDQIAELLDKSPKQIRGLWEQARRWLHQELSENAINP